MKKILLTLALIALIVAGICAWLTAAKRPASTQQADTTAQTRQLVASAAYTCDNGHTIAADYYTGPKAPQPAPGEPPTPTGSVDVSLDGSATTTLAQTISADGGRYATADGSLVFWSKGNTALIMRNNDMDPTYSNCATAQ